MPLKHYHAVVQRRRRPSAQNYLDLTLFAPLRAAGRRKCFHLQHRWQPARLQGDPVSAGEQAAQWLPRLILCRAGSFRWSVLRAGDRVLGLRRSQWRRCLPCHSRQAQEWHWCLVVQPAMNRLLKPRQLIPLQHQCYGLLLPEFPMETCQGMCLVMWFRDLLEQGRCQSMYRPYRIQLRSSGLRERIQILRRIRHLRDPIGCNKWEMI